MTDFLKLQIDVFYSVVKEMKQSESCQDRILALWYLPRVSYL